MIIVEGTDGVGKSTLARGLARKFRAPLVCFSPLPDWWEKHHYLTKGCMPFAVYDRFHISAWAYSAVAKQPWDATTEALDDLDKALKSRCDGRYTKILLYASDREWFDGRATDELFDVEQVKTVNSRFTAIKDSFDVRIDVCEGWASPDKLDFITRC